MLTGTCEILERKRIKRLYFNLFLDVILVVRIGRVFVVRVRRDEVFEVVLSPKVQNSTARALVRSIFFSLVVLQSANTADQMKTLQDQRDWTRKG